jgi:hypothetical protein
MGDRSGTSSKRRRRLLIAAGISVVIATSVWLWWPRIDLRLVGTWTDGKHQMVIGRNGFSDAFFVQYWDESEGPTKVPTYVYEDGTFDYEEVPDSYVRKGRIRIRTVGNRFEFAIPKHPTNTVTGLLNDLLAVLKQDATQDIFSGTIARIGDDTMVLDVDRFPWSIPWSIPGLRSKGAINLRRVKKIP